MLNDQLARQAWDEFYAATEEQATSLLAQMGAARSPPELLDPSFLQQRPFEARNSESYPVQLLEYVRTPPSQTTKRFLPVPWAGGLSSYAFQKPEGGLQTTVMQVAMATVVPLKTVLDPKYREAVLAVPLDDARHPLASMALTKLAVVESGHCDPPHRRTVLAELLQHMADLGIVEDTSLPPPVQSAELPDALWSPGTSET